MSSLFSAIRAAVRPGTADDILEHVEGEPGAQAPNATDPHIEALTPGGNMSNTQTLAGAAQAATATVAAAVAAASGGADGFKSAMDRMTAILGADGIKGDGKRMGAALDLASASPDMAADAVVTFVTANVPASTTEAAAPAQASQPMPAPGGYEASVQAAASLAMPGGAVSPAKAESGLSKAVSARIEAMKPAR